MRISLYNSHRLWEFPFIIHIGCENFPLWFTACIRQERDEYLVQVRRVLESTTYIGCENLCTRKIYSVHTLWNDPFRRVYSCCNGCMHHPSICIVKRYCTPYIHQRAILTPYMQHRGIFSCFVIIQQMEAACVRKEYRVCEFLWIVSPACAYGVRLHLGCQNAHRMSDFPFLWCT